MELLAVTEEAVTLAQALVETGPMPPTAAEDALHIAIAVTSGVEYLMAAKQIGNPLCHRSYSTK